MTTISPAPTPTSVYQQLKGHLDELTLADAASGIDPNLLAELGTCRFLQNATNVLLIGPPGVGKTHIATCLGHAAVNAGYLVYFTSAAEEIRRATTGTNLR